MPEITTFAIRYHQALRFFPDEDYGYEYPEGYLRVFGEDYTPEPYLQSTCLSEQDPPLDEAPARPDPPPITPETRAHEWVRNHKWYEHPRLVTVNDLYSFDPSAKVSIEPFLDIMGRHFKQPKEGLGWDQTSSSHMWRTMINPDRGL